MLKIRLSASSTERTTKRPSYLYYSKLGFGMPVSAFKGKYPLCFAFATGLALEHHANKLITLPPFDCGKRESTISLQDVAKHSWGKAKTYATEIR